MAYVPGCRHDVFVSYAHVDDLPFPGAGSGWVTTLIETLEVLLAQKLGRRDAYSLWMDHQLSRHEKLTPEILGNLQASATLLVVLSPGYLASEWCLREKDTFVAALTGNPLAGSRVFLIERDKVDLEERPAQFEDLLGYRFWVQEGAGQPPRTLGVPRPDPADPKNLHYFDELTRCCCNLADELKRLRRAAAAAETNGGAAAPAALAAAAAAADDRPAVLLAEATDDLEDAASALRRALEQAGFRVLPESWYPREPEAFLAAVDQDLARAGLFVQLLSGLAGRKPAGLPEGYVRAQHARALAAGKPVLQWRNRQLDPAAVEDPEHRAFLDSETVMAVGMEEFRRAVLERAAPPAAAPAPAAADPLGGPLVFVDADAGDLGLAGAVGDVLESRGLAYSMPMPAASPAEARADLEQNLLCSDALVIVQGGAAPLWVRNQLLMLRKVAWKRERPLSTVALVQGPPGGHEPLALGLPSLITVDCSRGIDEAALAPLLAALGTAA